MTGTAFTVLVEYADGDDWATPTTISEIEVEAATPLEARLIAEQMAYIPHPGKPGHIQIVRTTFTASPA